MKASVCEKKKRNLCECVDTYVRKYTWPKLRGVAMCMCVRACEKKMRNLIQKPFHVFCENLHHRKFPAIRYHIGEPSLIPKLLLPCVYDTMIMQFYY